MNNKVKTFLQTKPKIFIHYVFITILTFSLLEIASLMLANFLLEVPFKYQQLAQQRSTRITTIQNKLKNYYKSKDKDMFHPYVSYVGRPNTYQGKIKINEYGMFSIAGYPYPYKKNDNDFVFAVLGGSVASIFANVGEQSLRKYLHHRGFNKNLVLINLAKGGYKQPQQLFHLQYALLSGFEFDAVLNIDGFNDLALAVHNIDRNINPLFPSGFHMGMLSKMRTGHQFDPHTVEQLFNYYSLYSNELRLLSFIHKPPFSYSIFLNLLGELWTARNITKIKQLEYQLADDSQRTMTGEFRGPPFKIEGNKYHSAAKIWQNASKMLYTFCQANQLPYIHILQPNQYVEDSKPLSQYEQQHAFASNHSWGISARKGYQYLISAGNELKKQGVPFYDLTMIFKDVTEDLYTDTCCHFNPKGNNIMARRIAELIMQEIKR